MATRPSRRCTGTWLFLLNSLLLGLMLVPIHPALSASIASVSIVVFLPLFIASIAVSINNRSRLAFSGSLMAASGILVPQAIYIFIAQQTGTPLHFRPLSYIHFSGKSSLQPDIIEDFTSTNSNVVRYAVYNTKQQGLRPTVVLLHGGGWRYGNFLETNSWPKLLTEAGFTVISIDYSLANADRPSWQTAPTDIATAMNHVRSHASELRVKSDRISILGQSAGGHLALLESYSAQTKPYSVIALYAPVDLSYDYAVSRDKSAELDFIGSKPQDAPQSYDSLNPMRYVSDDSPRTLLIQGTCDDLVNYNNSIKLDELLQEYSRPHQMVLLPLTGHSFENQQSGFATQIAEHTVIDFLKD